MTLAPAIYKTDTIRRFMCGCALGLGRKSTNRQSNLDAARSTAPRSMRIILSEFQSAHIYFGLVYALSMPHFSAVLTQHIHARHV